MTVTTTHRPTERSAVAAPTTRIAEAKRLLTDERYDRPHRLARLQGWRDDGLTAAVAAGPHAQRVAPAACGVLALTSAATGSVALMLATLATAILGVFAPNHPFEAAYNVVVRRSGGDPLPANRAAKRFACAMASLHFAGAAVATVLGAPIVATVLLVTLGTVALFVAASGICIPSLLFAAQFGADRGARARLFG